jgi:hypothetical protein
MTRISTVTRTKLRTVKSALLAACLGVLTISSSQALAEVSSPVTTVTELTVYTDANGGDVFVLLAASHALCTGGVWLNNTDPGFRTAYAALLAAYHTGRSVLVRAYDGETWPNVASSCRIRYVQSRP